MNLTNDGTSVPPDRRPMSEQPAWRHDFPIDVPQDQYVARREFAKFMVLISAAFATGQFWIVFQSVFRSRKEALPRREIGKLKDIPVGSAQMFSYPDEHDSCLLVRLKENEFVAFSQKCTHLSCAVVAQPEQNRFLCPCHNGSFDIRTGKPTAGPPPRPLPRVTIEVRGESIYATGIEVTTV